LKGVTHRKRRARANTARRLRQVRFADGARPRSIGKHLIAVTAQLGLRGTCARRFVSMDGALVSLRSPLLHLARLFPFSI
jgi:hypothetical protein